MLRTTVNPNLTTHIPSPVTVFSCPAANTPLLRIITAASLLMLIMLVCTSYVKNPAADDRQIEFISPMMPDTLKALCFRHEEEDETMIAGEAVLLGDRISEFYRLHGYRPVWTHARGVSKRAESLLNLLGRAREYGLEPGHYHVPVLHELVRKINHSGTVSDPMGLKTDLELLLTDAAMGLMVNLRAGYLPLDSTLAAYDWYETLPEVLLRGIRQNRIPESILSVQPEFAEYHDLQHATARFVQAGPLSDRHPEFTYPAADHDLLLDQIREALIILGYLAEPVQHSQVIAALKRFQHDHGLDPDGKPGRNTLEVLELSRLDRYRILALNLDRLRKQPIYGEDHLYVNIPAYRLKIFRNNQLVDTFRVIVGHPCSPTPRLTGTMETIIANPVWFVPRSITLREILPKIKSDSGYLSRNGFKLLDEAYRTVDATTLDLKSLNAENFNYTLRQSRGTDNSLGQVKFVFSNPHAIYLHDTPGKALFNKDIRAFSHGCVRVKDPERLAGYIVREINEDTTDVARLIRQGGHHEIGVAGNLAIHIRYITCEADRAGNLYFFKDIYKLDKKELEPLVRLMESQNTGLLLSSLRGMDPNTGESCR